MIGMCYLSFPPGHVFETRTGRFSPRGRLRKQRLRRRLLHLPLGWLHRTPELLRARAGGTPGQKTTKKYS